MKINMKVKGIDQLIAQLRHTAEKVSDSARKTMHREADRIVEQARLYAPVDKHNLEESIRKDVHYGHRGRLQIDIVMGGIVNGVNVDTYAVEVHENYDDARPGPGTQAKRDANPGVHIGRKFLTRAMEERAPILQRAMISAVEKEFKL